ncbi:MAG: mechanosensitive ion channel family protein [Thermoplasmata archaeon]|nr:mechanosensitive ion channel family protein [Thermoplasmata archaeon]
MRHTSSVGIRAGGFDTNRLVVFSGQVAAAVMFWVMDYYEPNTHLENGFLTFLSLAVIYLVFKILLESILVRRIKDSKTKYSVRKALSIVYIIVFIGVLIQIWVTNTDAMFVSYGLMAAGIAIALQDFFKNFVGGLTIFLTGIYRVGDRVEVDSKSGDVIDIGLLYTTMLELREWVDGDEATGRLATVPNGVVLSKIVNNYTRDHNFIWDEITLPITYDSDWQMATQRFEEIARKETVEVAARAEVEMSSITGKYYFSKRVVEPRVYMKVTDNWISLTVRYITSIRERRASKNALYKLMLTEVQGSDGRIKFASETIDITHFPEISLGRDG